MTGEMTSKEIYEAGIAALTKELGPVGMIHFLRFFDNGHGDYLIERHAWLDNLTVDDIMWSIGERASREGSRE